MIWTILFWVGSYLGCGVVTAVIGSYYDGYVGNDRLDATGAVLAVVCWPVLFVAILTLAAGRMAHALGQKLRRKEPTE